MAYEGPGSPGHPLSFGPIWAHTLEILRRHAELLWPLGAAFLFLPQLFLSVLTPAPEPGQTPEISASLALIGIALASIAASLWGQLSLAFIAVNDGTAGLTLGQILRRSLPLLLPAFAVVMMQGIAIVTGFILLVIPGLWLFARLSMALPLVAVGPHDPLEALQESWRLTQGHALRILGCFSIMMLGFLMLYLGVVAIGVAVGAVSAITINAPSQGWGPGRWAFEVLAAAMVAVGGVVSMCFHASLLKALRAMPAEEA